MTNNIKSCNGNITLKHNGKIMNNPNDVVIYFMVILPMWLSKFEVKKF